MARRPGCSALQRRSNGGPKRVMRSSRCRGYHVAVDAHVVGIGGRPRVAFFLGGSLGLFFVLVAVLLF